MTQDKLDEFVLNAKARSVEKCVELSSMGNYGSYKFVAAKNRLMYLMSYIQTLDGYPLESGQIEEEDLLKMMEHIDLLTLE